MLGNADSVRLTVDGEPYTIPRRGRQGNLARFSVYVAEECFLTGTAAEVIPVVKVDNRVIGNGEPGPVTRDLMQRFKALVRG